MIAYFFIENCFKCDFDHYTKITKFQSVIMTIALLLRLATHE